jgi:hypothetical protein
MASSTMSQKGADPAVHAVLEVLPKCVAVLRAWADRLEQRHERFSALEADLSALFAHTEQLSAELENSRPTAPVYKNAGSALKSAVARSAKVLKDMHTCLDGAKDELDPPTQFRSLIEAGDKVMNACIQYVDEYREGCRAFEAGEMPAKDAQSDKKHKKDRKRSNSPKRPKESRSAAMLA